MVASEALPNKRFDRSGMSLAFIENLDGFAVVSRPVNRGVRRLIMVNPMKRMIKVAVVLLLLTSGVLAQRKSLPRFENYPVKENFRGKSAPVKLTSQLAHTFRTRLRENAAEGVNFAGHYIAATWGCGAACASFAIIDARTGQVYFIPSLQNVGGFGYSDEDLIQFRKNSRLLIVVGMPNDKGYVGRYYYVWKNNQLKLIRALEDRRWEPR
jgi:hypothetical protein